jgi:hypothetical protein
VPTNPVDPWGAEGTVSHATTWIDLSLARANLSKPQTSPDGVRDPPKEGELLPSCCQPEVDHDSAESANFQQASGRKRRGNRGTAWVIAQVPLVLAAILLSVLWRPTPFNEFVPRWVAVASRIVGAAGIASTIAVIARAKFVLGKGSWCSRAAR